MSIASFLERELNSPNPAVREANAQLLRSVALFVGSVVSLLNKRDDAAAFGDALTEIKTRAAPVRVLTADGAQALLASVGAREGAADERDSRVEVM